MCSRSGFPVCFHGDQSHEALRAASCGLCGIFLGGAVERHSRWNGFPCGSSSPGESEVCPHCCRLSGSGCVPRVAFSSQLCSDRSFTFLSCQGLSNCLVHPILVQTTNAQVVWCCIDTGGFASLAPRLPEHDICRAPRRVFFLTSYQLPPCSLTSCSGWEMDSATDPGLGATLACSWLLGNSVGT